MEASVDRFRKKVSPVTMSSANGTAARRRLKAMPPARKKTLSSPAFAQMRAAYSRIARMA
jgi:hypothetical protein